MTPAEFATAAAAALDPVLPGARALSDYRADLERLEPGEDRWQFTVGPAGIVADSNVIYGIVACAVTHRHRLANPLDERVWTEGALLVFLDTITRPAWWRALAHDVTEPPEYTVERQGPVIVAQVTVSVSLAP